MKACVVVPIFNHKDTIRGVVASALASGLPCLVVDDGSDSATRAELARLAEHYQRVEVVRHPVRKGKGAALKSGFRAAMERGYTHAVHLDADGQHDSNDIVRFVATLRAHPRALVLGRPVFDASVPKIRLYARQISRALVWLSTVSFDIEDPLCGFRGLPLAPVVGLLDRRATGNWMDFEPEIAVRMVWEGLEVVNLPTRVIYPEGGLSHFSLSRDYPRLASLYIRLIAGMVLRLPRLVVHAIGRESRTPPGPETMPSTAEAEAAIKRKHL